MEAGAPPTTHMDFLGLGGTVQLRQLQQRHEWRCGRDRDPHCAAGEASLLLPPHGVALRRQHHPQLSYVSSAPSPIPILALIGSFIVSLCVSRACYLSRQFCVSILSILYQLYEQCLYDPLSITI